MNTGGIISIPIGIRRYPTELYGAYRISSGMNQRRDGRYDATNPKTAAMLSKTKPFANSVVSWVTEFM